MGLSIGRLRENRNPTLEWLGEQCGRLGIDFACVCRRAYERGAIDTFVADAEAIEERFGRPHTLSGIRKRIRERATVDEELDVEVERLDSLRYDNPRRAAKLAKKALQGAVGPVAVAQFLGVLGSAHRTLYRLDWSMVELGLAITLTKVAGRRDIVAKLAQRAACVMRDRGKLPEAEAIVREALAIFAERGDYEGMACSLVDLGVTMNKLGRPTEALRQCKLALALEPVSQRHRYGAHHAASVAFIALGQHRAAAAEADSASAIAPPGRLTAGFTMWLRGRIAWKRGALDEAAELYTDAYRRITEPAADRLLIGAERVRVNLELGDAAAAVDEARALLTLHGMLEKDKLDQGKVLGMAALELGLAAHRAELSTELVESILGKIAVGRAARLARLRQRLRP